MSLKIAILRGYIRSKDAVVTLWKLLSGPVTSHIRKTVLLFRFLFPFLLKVVLPSLVVHFLHWTWQNVKSTSKGLRITKTPDSQKLCCRFWAQFQDGLPHTILGHSRINAEQVPSQVTDKETPIWMCNSDTLLIKSVLSSQDSTLSNTHSTPAPSDVTLLSLFSLLFIASSAYFPNYPGSLDSFTSLQQLSHGHSQQPPIIFWGACPGNTNPGPAGGWSHHTPVPSSSAEPSASPAIIPVSSIASVTNNHLSAQRPPLFLSLSACFPPISEIPSILYFSHKLACISLFSPYFPPLLLPCLKQCYIKIQFTCIESLVPVLPPSQQASSNLHCSLEQRTTNKGDPPVALGGPQVVFIFSILFHPPTPH